MQNNFQADMGGLCFMKKWLWECTGWVKLSTQESRYFIWEILKMNQLSKMHIDSKKKYFV